MLVLLVFLAVELDFFLSTTQPYVLKFALIFESLQLLAQLFKGHPLTHGMICYYNTDHSGPSSPAFPFKVGLRQGSKVEEAVLAK